MIFILPIKQFCAKRYKFGCEQFSYSWGTISYFKMAKRHIALSQKTYFVRQQENVTFCKNDSFQNATPFFSSQT